MKRKQNLFILILSVAVLTPLILSLSVPGTPHEFDMYFHLERITEFYRQLQEHQYLPTWSTYLAYGFGSPVLLFNYAFPYYLASVALSFGATVLDSFKFVTAFSYIGMFGFMYLFLNSITNPWAAIVGAAFYTWAPYHFDIIQHRGAMGEFTAMVFWPLLCWSVVQIFRKKYTRGFFIGALTWTLLLYSHPDLFIMILPLWMVTIIGETILTKNFRAAITSAKAFGMSIGLMAFYFIPSLLEHGYLGYVSHEHIFSQNFVDWQQLLLQPKIMEFGLTWGYFYKSLGWLYIAILIITAVRCVTSIRRIFQNRVLLYQLLFLGISGFAIFLVRPASTYLWEHNTFLTFITYPQRFLGLFVFCASVCAGLLLPKANKFTPVIAIAMCVAVVGTNYLFVDLNYVRDSEASLAIGVPDTTDVWGEFMPKDIPKDFIENGKYYALQPVTTPEFPCTQTSVSITCQTNTTSPQTIRFRQFYFPGWTAYADNRQTPIGKNTDGTILVTLTKPTTNVRIAFTQTPLRKFSDFVSVLFAGLYIFLLGKTVYTTVRKHTLHET